MEETLLDWMMERGVQITTYWIIQTSRTDKPEYFNAFDRRTVIKGESILYWTADLAAAFRFPTRKEAIAKTRQALHHIRMKRLIQCPYYASSSPIVRLPLQIIKRIELNEVVETMGKPSKKE